VHVNSPLAVCVCELTYHLLTVCALPINTFRHFLFLPAGHARTARPAAPMITLPFPRLFICASALITCAKNTSCTLLPCNLTLVDFGNIDSSFGSCYEKSTTVDFEMDTKKERQHRHNSVRLTESRNARNEQLNAGDAYRVANQQSLAYKWIRMSKARLKDVDKQ